MRRTFASLLAVGTVGTLLMLGGCTTERQNDQFISASDVRGKTPELATITRSEGQFQNKEARVINAYFRGMRSDISRALLLDQATRLTPHPMP